MNEFRQAVAVSPEDAYIPSEIKIDVALIPDHVREDLAAATLECVRNFLRQPGGREYLDTKIAAKKAATTAAQ